MGNMKLILGIRDCKFTDSHIHELTNSPFPSSYHFQQHHPEAE